MILSSFKIDILSHLKRLAELSYHKNVSPNSFDNWPYFQYQLYISAYLELADEDLKRKTKQQAEEEKAAGKNKSKFKLPSMSDIMSTFKLPKL